MVLPAYFTKTPKSCVTVPLAFSTHASAGALPSTLSIQLPALKQLDVSGNGAIGEALLVPMPVEPVGPFDHAHTALCQLNVLVMEHMERLCHLWRVEMLVCNCWHAFAQVHSSYSNLMQP